MPVIRVSDPDFRVCRIDFDTLIAIQLDAEERGWATRWTSVDALRSQVKEGNVFLQSMTREERGGAVHAYRCLLLFSAVEEGHAGGVATIDLDPARYASLERIDKDPDVREAMARMFVLATGGISMIAKR
ncbi:hypothetical protein [Streptomyces lavendulocolor]|uniref:hypothetical protein n=1 Tax=Streptomyces lavendulocolor TaxID=67316 RepID=UPI0031D8B937